MKGLNTYIKDITKHVNLHRFGIYIFTVCIYNQLEDSNFPEYLGFTYLRSYKSEIWKKKSKRIDIKVLNIYQIHNLTGLNRVNISIDLGYTYLQFPLYFKVSPFLSIFFLEWSYLFEFFLILICKYINPIRNLISWNSF